MAIPQQVRDDSAEQNITGSFTLRVQDDASERRQDDTILSSLVCSLEGVLSSKASLVAAGFAGPAAAAFAFECEEKSLEHRDVHQQKVIGTRQNSRHGDK